VNRNLLLRIFCIIISLGFGLFISSAPFHLAPKAYLDTFMFPQSSPSFEENTRVIEPHLASDITRRVHTLRDATAPLSLSSIISFDPEHPQLGNAQNPFTLATVTHNLRSKHHISTLLLDNPLNFDDSNSHGVDTLLASLEEFDRVVFAADLTYKNAPQELPYYLATLDPSQVHGEMTLLPEVNASIHSTDLDPPANSYAGFSSTSTGATQGQLLMRWQDSIIPSFSLLQHLEEESVHLSEITVRLGHYILLGHNRSVLPIDSFGCFSPPQKVPSSSQQADHFQADELWTSQNSPLSPCLIQTKPTASLSSMTSKLHSAPETNSLIQYQRMEIWKEALVLFDIALLFALFLHWRTLKRNLIYVIITLSLIPLLLVLYNVRQVWVPASSIFSSLIMSWLLSFLISPFIQTPPPIESEPCEP